MYRRSELSKWSTSVDRHLEELVKECKLQKLSQGIYFYPEVTVFGEAPPEEEVLVRSFLKDSRFCLLLLTLIIHLALDKRNYTIRKPCTTTNAMAISTSAEKHFHSE